MRIKMGWSDHDSQSTTADVPELSLRGVQKRFQPLTSLFQEVV